MNTYTVIVIMAIAATTVLAQGKRGFRQTLEECKTKVGGTDDDVEQIRKLLPPTAKTGQCLLACIEKKNGWRDADNKANVETAKNHLQRIKEHNPEKYEKLTKILDECIAQEKPEADECAAAKKFADCMYTKKQAAGVTGPH